MNNKITPNGSSKEAITKFGAEVAKAFGYQPGGDLSGLVSRIGGKIEVGSPSEIGEDGSLVSNGDGSFLIYLSPFTNELRDRFTIAHELGHLFLHANAGKKPLKVARAGRDRPEWEANWFAAGFLMPEAEFRAQVAESHSHAGVAAHFKVSTQAVRIRKLVLGICDPN
jgi:hypothetical protein